MPTYVELMIPKRFLLQHAIYMQTCAHIELATWHIVQIVEGFDPNDQIQIDRFLEIKRETWTLIKALERAAKKLPDELRDRVDALVERIKLGVENRNFAAHAAIYWSEKDNSLAAEHYFQRKIAGKKIWFHTIGQPIQEEGIAAAVTEADSILREAVSIRAALENQPDSTV